MPYRTVTITLPEVSGTCISLTEDDIIHPTCFDATRVAYYGAEIGHMRTGGNLHHMGVFLPAPRAGYMYEVVKDDSDTLVLILRKEK